MKDEFGVEITLRVLEEHPIDEAVSKVEDASLVDGVLDGALGRDGDEMEGFNLLRRIDVIMEYLVNTSKRSAFWSLNEDILMIYYSDYQYAVSVKEDTSYPCLHSPQTMKETSSICRIPRSPIRRIQDIVCEYSGRYQTWSLLQETPIRRIQSLGYAIWLFHHVIRGTSTLAKGLSVRMPMEHKDAQGQSVFIIRAWRRLFDIRVPLFQLRGVRRRMSRREFILVLGLYTVEEMPTVGFGAYWAESARQIPDKEDLRDYWIGISSAGDFLGTTPSYTVIQDLILRFCHRLIACSIAGRSQAPEKVTVTDLFYLRGMDVGSINVPYYWLDNTWAWVAMGPERQQVEAAGTPKAAEDAPIIVEGDKAVPAPVQAPQQPPPPPSVATRTMP
ncbi:hypothetical protein Tco_1475654 [Tanacetum coccineum]